MEVKRPIWSHRRWPANFCSNFFLLAVDLLQFISLQILFCARNKGANSVKT